MMGTPRDESGKGRPSATPTMEPGWASLVNGDDIEVVPDVPPSDKRAAAEDMPLRPSTPSGPPRGFRRHAKTPISRVGELEGDLAVGEGLSSRLGEPFAPILTPSADFRAAPRDEDLRSEPPPSPQPATRLSRTLRRQRSAEDLSVACGTPMGGNENDNDPLARSAPGDTLSSPSHSDDGTLVSFDEDTIYFKPVSFPPQEDDDYSPTMLLRGLSLNSSSSPPPPVPPPRRRHAPPAPDNLSLQIATDLLMHELASSVFACTLQPQQHDDGASTPPNDSVQVAAAQKPYRDPAAMQFWVMIEAYERLRDLVALGDGAGAGAGIADRLTLRERRCLAQMFDMWLRALYGIHQSLVMDPEERRDSWSDYGEIPVEVLD